MYIVFMAFLSYENVVVQHDNDEKHTAKIIRKWFQDKVISWPKIIPLN